MKAAALRSEERLAELLGARDRPLLCEELALRARLDLDQDRSPTPRWSWTMPTRLR